MIVWNKTNTRTTHPILGRRVTLRSKCKRFSVDRFLDTGTDNPFIAVVDNRVISRHRKLAAGKRACETFDAKGGTNGK